ncbi:MAG: hypothetical protein U5J64_05955 [Halobacteriales archaeon]|nr:hypothetical protein [Halobacteriales archaeon]
MKTLESPPSRTYSDISSKPSPLECALYDLLLHLLCDLRNVAAFVLEAGDVEVVDLLSSFQDEASCVTLLATAAFEETTIPLLELYLPAVPRSPLNSSTAKSW